jgi:hypothetical protein
MSRNTDIVVTGVGAGALATIIVWILNDLCKIKVPPEIVPALTSLMTVIAGWFVPMAASKTEDENI